MIYARHESPVGPLLLAGDGVALKVIGFDAGKGRVDPGTGWEERRDAFRGRDAATRRVLRGHAP